MLVLELGATPAPMSMWRALETFLFPCVFVLPCLALVNLIFHNRDNVEWSEEQEASARSKVQENSSRLLPQDKQGTFGVCPHVSLGLVPGMEQSGQRYQSGQDIVISSLPPLQITQKALTRI